MTRKSRRCWSKSIGEPGRRVRLYEARPGGSIMRSVFTNGKEDRESLKHRDKERAIGEGTSWFELCSRTSKRSMRDADIRALERFVTFLGRSRNVETLSESNVQRFILVRRAGETRVGILRWEVSNEVQDRATENG